MINSTILLHWRWPAWFPCWETDRCLHAVEGPRDYQRTAPAAMKEGKWQEALDAVDRCIRAYEPRIKMLGLDDGFGWFANSSACLSCN